MRACSCAAWASAFARVPTLSTVAHPVDVSNTTAHSILTRMSDPSPLKGILAARMRFTYPHFGGSMNLSVRLYDAPQPRRSHATQSRHQTTPRCARSDLPRADRSRLVRHEYAGGELRALHAYHTVL